MASEAHRRTSDVLPALRGTKRKRTSAPETEAETSLVFSSQADSASEPRTRGATACDKCRSRKTRCDGVYPICGYCSKHGIECVYPESTTQSTALASGQILDAIRDLSALVETKHNRCATCGVSLEHETTVHRPGSVAVPYKQTHSVERIGTSTHDPDQIGPFRRAAQPPLQPRGIETILSWRSLTHLKSQRCFFAGESLAPLHVSSVPNLHVDKLCQLEAKYIEGVHSKNPVLDLATLHRLVLDVAENGLDWSTRTCLVCLVFAIGAITQQYQDQHLSPSNQLTPGAPQLTATTTPVLAGTEPDLALQFWSISVKRLGLAIGQRDVQAVQCLCLAGIWYMHQMDPMQAWQYFNLAASAWYAIGLVDHALYEDAPSNDNSGSLTVMQALYFTIWKSLCEIKLEIDVPGVFDHVGLPYDFPLAPDSGDVADVSDMSSSEYIWYYYLAEIAARHQTNRIANTLNWSCREPTSKEIKTMLSLADTLEAQIQNWYASLPSSFYFEIPSGFTLVPHPNDMTQILRSLYLSCRELIGRCFLWLCLETQLACEEPLRQQVLTYASKCLRFCMLKLCQVAPHRHQGTWFGVRSAAAATLTLCAVDSAKGAGWSTSLRELELPENWYERAIQTVEVLGPLWNEPVGGASEIGILIRTALAASSASSEQLNDGAPPWQ